LVEIGVHAGIMEVFLGHPIKGLTDLVEFWVKAGYDFVPWPVGLLTVLVAEYRQRGPSSMARAILKAAKAKYSVSTEEEVEKLWAQEGAGAITTLEELDAFPWPTAQDFDYSILDSLARRMPEGMKVIPTTVGYLGPAYFLMGAETLFLSLYENPGLVEKLMERAGNIELEVLEVLLGYDCVGAIWITDDIAYSDNLLISPKHLRQYLFPWFKRAIDLCRKRGCPVIYHSDGDISSVIGDLIDCGFNAIHPIEPKAMDIAYLKRTVGDKVCLIGNIDLDYTLTLGTPEEVAEETKQRIHDIAPGGGYCVSSSNSIPEYVPFENYEAMRQTALRYGNYPISI